VYYSGDVQGVGFRATAVSISRRHPTVRGWVRNLPDGRVELLADGTPKAVQAFLDEISFRMSEYIAATECFERDAKQELAGFHIRH